MELVKALAKAQKSKRGENKIRLLNIADEALQDVKFLLRLAKDFKYVSLNKYGQISSEVVELGSMLGGWLRYAQKG